MALEPLALEGGLPRGGGVPETVRHAGAAEELGPEAVQAPDILEAVEQAIPGGARPRRLHARLRDGLLERVNEIATPRVRLEPARLAQAVVRPREGRSELFGGLEREILLRV